MSNHKTNVKTSAGRFYAESLANMVRDTSPATFGFREYDWVDRNGDRIYQPGEETLFRRDTRPNPDRLQRIDSNLKNQYSDVSAVRNRASARIQVGRFGHGNFQTRRRDASESSTPPSRFRGPIPLRSPIRSTNRSGSTRCGPSFLGLPGQTIVTNPGTRPGDTDPLVRKYNGLELVLRKRGSADWQLEGSYVLGHASGNVSNSFAGSLWADYTNPNSLVNRTGRLPMDIRHQFKLYGSYQVPHGPSVSASFQVLSGLPWNDNFQAFDVESPRGATLVRFFKTQFPQIESETFIDVAGEPAGTRRFDTQQVLDLRAEKKFPIGYRTLSVIADVFNVLNANTIVRDQQSPA